MNVLKIVLKNTGGMNICILMLCLAFMGCQKRFKCDDSNSKKLGDIEFSEQFGNWNNELKSDSIVFSTPSGNVSLRKVQSTEKRPQRVNEYLICESIDIKPQYAYAYYEYKDLSSFFSSDYKDGQHGQDSKGAIISVSPSILREKDDVKTESIFLSFNVKEYGLKGRVPVTHTKSMQPTKPFGLLFEFHASKMVGDKTLQDVWVLEENDSALYYNKNTGIVAIKMGDVYWYRLK